MRILLRILIGVLLTAILLMAVVFTVFYFRSHPCLFDQPRLLSETTETIEVVRVNWACDCADYIELKHRQNDPDYETRGEDCIFIEPASPGLKLKDSSTAVLKLTGRFYKDRGIPSSYEMKTAGNKPDKAKVFRYDKIEVILDTSPVWQLFFNKKSNMKLSLAFGTCPLPLY